MKKKLIIALIALTLLCGTLGTAMAAVWFDTSREALEEAENSPAMWEQRIIGDYEGDIRVDTVIHFDYAGQTYTTYHVDDGRAYGFFLPVVYSEQPRQDAFWDTDDAFAKGYAEAEKAMMDAYWAMRSTPELGDRTLPEGGLMGIGLACLAGMAVAKRRMNVSRPAGRLT